MKTRDQVSTEKLRGGFYSPESLVQVCLDRVHELLGSRTSARLLEPSAGDGAFLRALAQHPLKQHISEVRAVELLPEEAAKAQGALAVSGLPGCVVQGSALDEHSIKGMHDIAVGNPPFVRFQFVSPQDKVATARIGEQIGTPLSAVSNLWIPVFLHTLSRLRDGGVFSFIIPAECFTGLAARSVRDWLGRHTLGLRVDLFPPRSFPNVLQEVIVLSGRVTTSHHLDVPIEVHDHGNATSWNHRLARDTTTWTGLLLRPEHLDALATFESSPAVVPFAEVAKLSVATVTGANDYFCIDDGTVHRYDLGAWTRPLLDRARHAPGLRYDHEEHDKNRQQGRTAWLLDSRLSSTPTKGALAYIKFGEDRSLHTRYKTRTREPWWQVPVVQAGTLMLSKRSNHYPRLIHNAAGVVTTDTVYQGSPLPRYEGREKDIVGSFHNSLTLLSAEMSGRSFGGGVLELVPSEIAQLVLPLVDVDDDHFQHLDGLCRNQSDPEALVAATDEYVGDRLGAEREAWALIADARRTLRDRRLARTSNAQGQTLVHLQK